VYARNEIIVRILRLDGYKIKFPIYATMINSNFRQEERRKELLEEAYGTFESLFPSFPNDCTENIFSYLSDEDLKILIHATNFN